MESISSKHVVARKEHFCDFCNGIIKKGEKYNNQVNKFEGVPYTWRSHEHCLELINELDMDTDDGVTDQAFSDYVYGAYQSNFPEQVEYPETSVMAKLIYDKICEKDGE